MGKEKELYYMLFNQMTCTIERLTEEVEQLKAMQILCEEKLLAESDENEAKGIEDPESEDDFEYNENESEEIDSFLEPLN